MKRESVGNAATLEHCRQRPELLLHINQAALYIVKTLGAMGSEWSSQSCESPYARGEAHSQYFQVVYPLGRGRVGALDLVSGARGALWPFSVAFDFAGSAVSARNVLHCPVRRL